MESSTPRTQPDPAERFRYEYGAGPLHLIAVIATLALTAYAILRILGGSSAAEIILWLFVAIIAHDFIALPLYSLFNRIAEIGVTESMRPRARALLVLNHVRIPAAFSLLLLLISFPNVFRLQESYYTLTTGLDLDRFLANWLLLTAGMFVISGLILAVQLRRAGRWPDSPKLVRGPAPAPPAPPPRALVWAARAVLAVGALVAAFALGLAIWGTFDSFPI